MASHARVWIIIFVPVLITIIIIYGATPAPKSNKNLNAIPGPATNAAVIKVWLTGMME